jgi:hypothetical protein
LTSSNSSFKTRLSVDFFFFGLRVALKAMSPARLVVQGLVRLDDSYSLHTREHESRSVVVGRQLLGFASGTVRPALASFCIATLR